MTNSNQRQWSAWYSLKNWFKSLFESEGEALLNTYENNPPPDVGFHLILVMIMRQVKDDQP